MVEGVKLCLESNPIPTRDSNKTLSAPGPRDAIETEPELYLSFSYGGTGQQWTAEGAGALGAIDLGMA